VVSALPRSGEQSLTLHIGAQTCHQSNGPWNDKARHQFVAFIAADVIEVDFSHKLLGGVCTKIVIKKAAAPTETDWGCSPGMENCLTVAV
jgi:hypothetical protein